MKIFSEALLPNFMTFMFFMVKPVLTIPAV